MSEATIGKLSKEQKEQKLLEDEQRWEEERRRRKRAFRTESNLLLKRDPET